MTRSLRPWRVDVGVVDPGGVLTVDAVHTNAEPLQLAGHWIFHLSATWSGPVTLLGTDLTLGTFSGLTGRIAGAISGTGVGVEKLHGGWLFLDGSNSVSGTLTNNDGHLTVNGSSRGLNVEQNFGVLGGTGEVANLTVAFGAIVRAGQNRSGVLTCSNFTVAASTPTFYVDVTPTGNNVLRARGTVQLDGNILVAEWVEIGRVTKLRKV